LKILDKLFYRTKTTTNYRDEKSTERVLSGVKVTLVITLLILVPIMIVATAPFRTVPQNNVAIRYNRVTRSVDTSETYREGLHYSGFFGAFYAYPLNVQRFEFEGNDQITVRTHDGLSLDIKGWVQYRIQSQNIGQIYRTYGTFAELSASLTSPTRSAANNIISRESADYVYKFKDQLGDKFTEELNKFYGDYFVTVTSSDFRSIDFPESYENAQKQKLEAEQLIDEARFDLEQEKIRAEQAIVNAEGIANSTIKLAEGNAQAAFEVREHMDMSNAEYLQWLYLQQLGNLDSPQIVIVTGDEVPEFLIPLAEGQE
jgi:regulator of protease activity HflC (stomatin/prohibitin superfamily)